PVLTGTKLCPQCGSELPADALQGLCPRCLLQGGLSSATPPRDSASKNASTKLDRFVALKVLPPASGQDPAFVERFALRSPRLASRTPCRGGSYFTPGAANIGVGSMIRSTGTGRNPAALALGATPPTHSAHEEW